MVNSRTTIIAAATPFQESALIVLRGSGSFSERFLMDVFNLKKTLIPRHAYFGKYRNFNGDVLDECVFVFFKGPNSYTGEDSFEISCHGNPLIANKLVADARARGCEAAKPGEFTQRAFLNGKIDLSQAEAVQTLIAARSEEEIESSQKLLSGELKTVANNWATLIYNLIADLEASLDFSEEEIPLFHVEQQKNQLQVVISELSNLIARSRYVTNTHAYLTVAIVGAPNAGKSSLFNVLVGNNRAIVAPIAGTTRDFISETITIKNHTIRLIDTAGLREKTEDPIEIEGMKQTVGCLKDADLVLYLLDGSQPLSFNLPAIDYLDRDRTLLLITKSDLPKAFNDNLPLKDFERVSISLKTTGIFDDLSQIIIEFLKKHQILPPAGTLFLGLRQLDLLKQVQALLIQTHTEFGMLSQEFHVEQLRTAVNLLEQLMGRYDNERTLDKIFSSFCIGK